jgi:hypothetical protein
MASTHSCLPAVICAENISLLYLLHSVPIQPSSNETNQPLVREHGYTLSFTRERSLVSTLAFLSYTKDDINHIPALCIQENPRSGSMSVILAVNRKTYEGGSQALRDLRQKFERLFAILSETVEGTVISLAQESISNPNNQKRLKVQNIASSVQSLLCARLVSSAD